MPYILEDKIKDEPKKSKQGSRFVFENDSQLKPQTEEPVPYDIQSSLNAYREISPLKDNVRNSNNDLTDVLFPFTRPYLAMGYESISALNRGTAGFMTHLDLIADYISDVTGTEKGGIFKDAANLFESNTSYWQERANNIGITFFEELIGEAIGGAVPGITQFALDLGSGLTFPAMAGFQSYKQQDRNPAVGAIVGAAKVGTLGYLLHQVAPLKQYLRAPAMGTIFGTQTYLEGGDTKEIAKGVGTGVLFSLSSPGGKMGLSEIRKGLEKETVLKKAEDKQTQSKDAEVKQETPPKEEPKIEDVPITDTITKRSDLVRFLKDNLDIPIRTGRFRDKALGIFKPKEEVIRTREANDIETISHEVGHALQKFLWPDSMTKTGLSSKPFSLYGKELRAIATEPKSGQSKTPEGFAEFIRLYITNEQKAREAAPTFYEHFDKLLIDKSPESRDILINARNQYQKYLDQPSVMKVLSQISINEKELKTIAPTLDNIYTKFVDDLYPLKKIVGEMESGVLPPDNPYELARLLRGWSGKVDAFVRNSPFEFKTYKDVGKPLKSILAPIQDRIDEFRAYIVSKRAIELNKRGIETGIAIEDAKNVIKKYDITFRDTFKDLKEYQDHTLRYLKDSGILSDETYLKIKELNDDYVPFYRVMDDSYKKGVGFGVGLESRNPIKKITGSWRDIQDPLESIIKNTYLYINLAEKNAVGMSLVKLAEKKQGMGKFIEKIPTPMKGTKIDIEEILTPEQLSGLKELGIELDDTMSFFRPSAFVPKDNVISVWIDGKRNLYEVHPEVARSFHALDAESSNTIIKLLNYPASWLRAGSVLTPEFIGRNPIRDQFSAFIYSKYGYVPGYDFARGIYHLAKKDKDYWDWKKGGGDHSMLVSMDREYLQDNVSNILGKYPVKDLIKNPVEMLRILSEVGEAGTRIGEFSKGIKKEGRTKEGIQHAALSARGVTLDFGRRGATGKAINSIIAFWNATVQGNDKMIRELKDDPLGKGIKIAAAITLPSVLLAIANNDDPRVQNASQWEKDLFWLIPTENHLYRIPKPFELGIIFGSIPERITRDILSKDPHAFDGLLESLSRGASPGMIPTAAIPLIENYANRSLFFDRPIVPQNRVDLLSEYQFGPYTTKTAKELGKLLGKLKWTEEYASPAQIDNLVRGWTGGLGMYALQIADIGLEATGISPKQFEEPTKTLSDIPFIKAFVVRYPSANTSNIQRFYDNWERQAKIMNSLKMLEKKGQVDELTKLIETKNIVNLSNYKEALSKIHNTIDAVYEGNMTPDEKREFIDILYKQMTEIATQGNLLFDEIKKEKR